jgi:hypothetical protein
MGLSVSVECLSVFWAAGAGMRDVAWRDVSRCYGLQDIKLEAFGPLVGFWVNVVVHRS